MTLPTITAAPPPPSRNDPANFSTRADAHVAYIATLVSDINALVAAVNAYGNAFPLSVPAGTAAAPGIAVAGDDDTGLFRPGANIFGVATGGAERARFSAAGLQLTGLLSGTAVTQSADDVTAGRLLRVGDGGVNLAATVAAPTITDANATTSSGAYRTTGSTVNLPVTDFGILEVTTGIGGGQVFQTWYASGSTAKARVYQRKYQSSAWTAWAEVYGQHNILGTVSQSGGSPTGALFGTGSNANGRYEMRADGYLECAAALVASSSGAQAWTFPVAFAEAPVVTVTGIAASGMACGQLDAAPGTTSCTFSVRDKSDARLAATAHLRAIGRWSTMT